MTHQVFKPASLAGIQLQNRIIRSATHEGMADEQGVPTGQLKKLYLRLAKGGAGAIITGYAGIQQDGKSPLKGMTMIDYDALVPAYKEITDAVHEFKTPIIMQIAHCGRQTRSKVTGLPTVAPSPIRDQFYNEDLPKELTEKSIHCIIDNFIAAIVRAQNAGFDGVQLHGAHGYLLSAFLSSWSNRRTDKWGGSTKNKYRIIGEILKRANEAAKDFPVFIKMNAHDGRKNGITVNEAVEIAKMLEQSGCAGIEVSSGVVEDGLYTIRGEQLPADPAMEYTFKYKSLPGIVKTFSSPVLKTLSKQPKPLRKYNLSAAIRVKQSVGIPVIVVGGIDNMADINEIIEENGIDFVSMSRPFIAQANVVEKFKQGKQVHSKCIKCNYCVIIGEERPLKCYQGKLPNKNS